MSTRGLHASTVTEIAKDAVQPVLFCDMDFDSAPLRLWTGITPISWDSKTWLGSGDLGKVSVVKETSGIEAENLVLTFNGISSDWISTTFNEDYQGREVGLWLGFILNDAVVLNPVKLFVGRMDVMSIDEGPETSKVSMTVENKMIDLLKPKTWRYTDEDQQIDYAGDLGLEFVVALQNKELKWAPS